MNGLRGTLVMLVMGAAALMFADSAAKGAKPVSASAAVSATETDQQWMAEGEKRYRENCGRCHQPPHKFPPRAMATAIRHMRVRAMLTDSDTKYIVYYMTH